MKKKKTKKKKKMKNELGGRIQLNDDQKIGSKYLVIPFAITNTHET